MASMHLLPPFVMIVRRGRRERLMSTTVGVVRGPALLGALLILKRSIRASLDIASDD
jgi:hypothetical protein